MSIILVVSLSIAQGLIELFTSSNNSSEKCCCASTKLQGIVPRQVTHHIGVMIKVINNFMRIVSEQYIGSGEE